MTRRRGGRLAAALAAAALLTATVPVAAASEADGPRLGAGAASDVQLGHRDQVRPEVSDAGPSRVSTTASGSLADVFFDYCDDANDRAVDLFEARIADRRAVDGTIGLRYGACAALTTQRLTGGILLVVDTSAGGSFLVDLFFDEAADEVVVLVVDRETDTLVHRTTGRVDTSTDEVVTAFPATAIGDPAAFAFEILALDDTLAVLDTMPEVDEPLGVWPASCTVEAARHTAGPATGRITVTEDPSRPGVARAAVRAAGLVPSGADERGVFEVTLPDASDLDQVRNLDGVVEARPSLVFSPADVAGDTGTDAWWRTQVQLDTAPGVTGQGVTIAVIDDGVDGTRAEFGGRVAAGYDAVRQRTIAAGTNSSRGGHGNHVAGIAAAGSDTVVGVAAGATVRPYQVFTFDGCGTDTSVRRSVAAAIDDGVDIINLSLGADTRRVPAELVAEFDRAAAAGIVVVAAAGNTGRSDPNFFPASHPGTVAVGATDRDGGVAGYSSSGPWMDILAPGGGLSEGDGIVSLGPRTGEVTSSSGTSMATPVVAGAAALYLEAGGSRFGPDLVRTAQPLDDVTADRQGDGLLQVSDLLALAGDDPPPATDPPPPVREPGTLQDIAGVCADAPTGVFPDVLAGNAHRNATDCLSFFDITQGFADGTYRPEDDVDRGQMATFLVRLIEGRTGATLPTGEDTFGDLGTGVHRPAVLKLSRAGLVGGFEDGSFRPTATVTRGQMAAFMSRTVEMVTGDTMPRTSPPFADHRATTHETAVEKVATGGIAAGFTDRTYRPGDDVSRGQMASFLTRSLAFIDLET